MTLVESERVKRKPGWRLQDEFSDTSPEPLLVQAEAGTSSQQIDDAKSSSDASRALETTHPAGTSSQQLTSAGSSSDALRALELLPSCVTFS